MGVSMFEVQHDGMAVALTRLCHPASAFPRRLWSNLIQLSNLS